MLATALPTTLPEPMRRSLRSPVPTKKRSLPGTAEAAENERLTRSKAVLEWEPSAEPFPCLALLDEAAENDVDDDADEEYTPVIEEEVDEEYDDSDCIQERGVLSAEADEAQEVGASPGLISELVEAEAADEEEDDAFDPEEEEEEESEDEEDEVEEEEDEDEEEDDDDESEMEMDEDEM